jgi:hypothetical protein
MTCKSTRTLILHFSSSPLLSEEKPTKAMDKGKQPQEDSIPKKRTIRE